jgi:putative sterol carrier protein
LNKPTYKECLMKGVDPLDGEYIDWKLDEKFEEISPHWKNDIKEEIVKEVKMEMNEKFEELKKEYNAKFDISFSDEDIIEIGGHGQKSEE